MFFVKKARRLKEVGAPSVRLLTKAEVMAVANASFPSIWQWMRDGKFPRSRIVNGRSMWLSTEIEQWLVGIAGCVHSRAMPRAMRRPRENKREEADNDFVSRLRHRSSRQSF